ncbi:MAG: hypothetical protein M1831_001983 [Alyxoria varia]|nr:MAG: hypothetical protein M1831_001983 [Alyxoria varia]
MPPMSYYRAIEGTNTAQAHPKFFKWLRADDSYDMPVWNMMIEHLIPVMMRVYFTEWVHFILHGAVIYAMTRDLIARSNASGDTVMRPLDDVWSALLEGGTALRDLLGNAQLNGFRCDPRIARLKDDLILEATARWSRQSGPGDVFRARFNVDIEKSSEGAKDDIVGADSSDAADSGPDTQARNAERTPSSGTHDTVGVSISEDGDDPAVASRGHLFSEHFDWTRMTRDEAIAVRALLQDLGAKFHNMIDEALRLVDGLDTEVAPVGGALQSCEYGFEVAQYGLNVAINTPTTRWKEPAERDFILRDQQGLRRQQDPTIEAEDEDVNIEDDDDDDDDGEPLLKRPRLNVEGSKNRA